MDSIWVTKIVFQPAGALTFRRMPSGLLHIMTYPFMPPTTMSGFLKRLCLIAEGNEWPGYGEDWFQKKKNAPGREFTLTLETEYRALGAFPEPNEWTIHKTRRHGPKHFKHNEFSQIVRSSHKENYQLHHWDYLFCESLKGWVAAREKEPLERLGCLENFGGKSGKEGYLVVRHVSEPRRLPLSKGEFRPLGLVTSPFQPSSGRFYATYGHHWNAEYQWTNMEKGGVDGFFQVNSWWNADRVRGYYWAMDDGKGFPANAADAFLIGDVEPFWRREI